jgi:hypothetical protein
LKPKVGAPRQPWALKKEAAETLKALANEAPHRSPTLSAFQLSSYFQPRVETTLGWNLRTPSAFYFSFGGSLFNPN